MQGGHVVPILGGTRLVGRLGDWDLGLIEMQTARIRGLPLENFGVFRLRRQVFNPYSYAGGLVTSRVDENGRYNVAYGLDSYIRLFGDDYLTVKWSQTFDDDLIEDHGFDFLDAGLFQTQWVRRRSVGFNYVFSATHGGPDYQPGMGFTSRQNFTELGWYLSYDWLMDERTAFQRLSPIQFFGYVDLRNVDGTVESALFEYDTDFYWKSGSSIWMDFEIHDEDLQNVLNFPNQAEVPSGSYTFVRHEGGYNMPPWDLFRASINWGLAQFYDGWRVDLSV